MQIPGISEIKKAARRIDKYIHRTPLLRNTFINEQAEGNIYFKCENFQKVGAFKIRGASNVILSLTKEQSSKRVATHSSGNHAQAIALAAKNRNIQAHIVMPEDAPEVKVRAVRDYSARIIFCDPTLEARQQTLEHVVEKTGALFIHPYNDPGIIAGQGTCAFEVLEDMDQPDMFLAPVGGGGLISGTAITAKETSKDIRVIGVEPETVNDAKLSLETGKLQPATGQKTVADGLRTSLGDLTFSCIQNYVDTIVTVTEQEIIAAMRTVWERMKIIIEASSAVPVAAVLNGKIETGGKTLCIILSGGNVDLNHLPWNRSEDS